MEQDQDKHTRLEEEKINTINKLEERQKTKRTSIDQWIDQYPTVTCRKQCKT